MTTAVQRISKSMGVEACSMKERLVAPARLRVVSMKLFLKNGKQQTAGVSQIAKG